MGQIQKNSVSDHVMYKWSLCGYSSSLCKCAILQEATFALSAERVMLKAERVMPWWPSCLDRWCTNQC